MKINLCRNVLLSAVWALTAARGVLANTDASAAPPKIELSIKLHRDYMIIARGSIGGLDDLNFLIDTGAVPSLVDPRVVETLNGGGQTVQVSVFTQNIGVQEVVLPRISLGPIQLENHPALARDLSIIQRETGIRIDALIGLDVLARSNFAIDYKAKKMIFGAQLPSAPTMPLQIGPGCMLLPVQVGERVLRLVVDTGARDIMLFESRVKAYFPKLRANTLTQAANLGGAAALKQVRLPKIRVGDWDLGRQWAVLIPSTPDSTPDFDGLLGLNSLGVKQVYFDFQQQLMAWVR